MADVDKSLDEIILSRNFNSSGKRGRGRGRGRGGMRGGGRTVIQGGRGTMQRGRGSVPRGRGGMQRGRVTVQSARGGGGQGTWKPRGHFRGGKRGGGGGGDWSINQQNPQPVTMPTPMQVNQSLARKASFKPQQTISIQLPDAREKLNFKARQTDARIRLNKKAQQTDARVKLNAKRRFSGEGAPDPLLPTQPNKMQQGQISRTIGNIGLSQPVQTGLTQVTTGLTQVTIRNPGAKPQPIQTTPTQITIKNPQANRGQQQQVSKKNKRGNIISLKKQTGNTPDLQLGGGSGLKITTVNQAATQKFTQKRRAEAVSVKPELSYDDYVSPPKIKRETITHISPPTQGLVRIKPPPVVPSVPRVSALQRVSAPRVGSTPHLSNTPVIQGTRIIISNLHPVVSEVDIKELFGAIGTIIRARLVRPGLSEVIYTKREQALLAISTYHDRELDGQPMQCKLDTSSVPESPRTPAPRTGMVTAATVAAATAAVQQKPSSLSDRFKLYSRSNVELPASGMRSDSVAHSQDSTIDSSVIHKALFKTGVQANPSKPVLFTVKI